MYASGNIDFIEASSYPRESKLNDKRRPLKFLAAQRPERLDRSLIS